jgi:hypothetical protein
MAGSPSCGQNERPRIWCVIVQADREMLAFNDHPARRWEPERLGLLLFSIAARITSHAWRTYYGFRHAPLAYVLAAALARLQALPSPT